MGQPPQRKRFNAKARTSTAGGSSHKKKSRERRIEGNNDRSRSGEIAEWEEDANASVLQPKSNEEKERDMKERLRQEFLASSQSKLTSKKKRRLDSYIDKKLRKEERVILLEKLAKSQAELPSSLNLQSSSFLGSGKLATLGSRLEHEEDKEIRRFLGGPSKRKRKRGGFSEEADSSARSEEDVESIRDRCNFPESASLGESNVPDVESVKEADDMAQSRFVSGASTSKEFGSALRRNEDGSLFTPRLVKRKKKGKRKLAWGRVTVKGTTESGSVSSFDSSDSSQDENDSVQNTDDSLEESSDPDTSESGEEGQGADNGGEDDSMSPELQNTIREKRKRGNFKEWALKQISAIKGQDAPIELRSDDIPSSSELHSTAQIPPPLSITAKEKSEYLSGPLGETLQLPETSFTRHILSTPSPQPKRHVVINRSPEIQAARLMLPALSEEQPIMEAILLNPVVIICGETGSGKTTQVPQFLFEAGFGSPGSDNPGMIGITQPRRVAAMSMASRVAQELSLPPSRVSYQIRYDATVSPSSSIKFMTDGVLLRELATDFLLSKYSVVIVDEAHERSMNTDILIGVLSRVMKLREDLWKKGKEGARPLRLVIMSATLRVTDFSENRTLFPNPPAIINISARQHPVTTHFSRRTSPDYVTETVRKAIKIHGRLPAGGILIFLTGQNEISAVCKKLEKKFGRKALAEKKRKRASNLDLNATEDGDAEIDEVRRVNPRDADVEPEDIDIGSARDGIPDFEDDEEEDIDGDGLDSDTDEKMSDGVMIDEDDTDVPMHIVPLYSLLSSEKQMKVFQPPPPDARLVVVATNVAETSLTIPGIRYVVDCGRAKQRIHEAKSGIQSFQVGWISKASAAQRAGRAGRTGPGHCYRLYSSALFENHFQQFAEPEILRVPIEGVVLQMKSMHINAVINFPFPTPPDRQALKRAETILTRLGALENSNSTGGHTDSSLGTSITDLGRAMSLFPVSPRFSKMIVSAKQRGCLPYVISIVSALSVGDPFLREEHLGSESSDDDLQERQESNSKSEYIRNTELLEKEQRKQRRHAFYRSQQLHSSLGNATSDVFRTLSVVGAYEYDGGGPRFCAQHFVRTKAMEEIHKLRSHISRIVQASFPTVDPGYNAKLPPPNDSQIKILRQLLTAGFIDQVAIRKDLVDKTASGTKYESARGVAYQAIDIAEDVFIHPSSVLFHRPPPDFIVFEEVLRTSKAWLKGLTAINPAWLPTLGRPLCTFSKSRGLPSSMKGATVVTPMFGPGWELPPLKLSN